MFFFIKFCFFVQFRLDEYGGFEVLRHIWRAQSNMTHEMADTLMELIIEKVRFIG